MLITKYVEMKWNSKNKTYYENLGYTYTKMKDIFLIDVNDLKNGSNVKVEVKCDYNDDGCCNISDVEWIEKIIQTIDMTLITALHYVKDAILTFIASTKRKIIH